MAGWCPGHDCSGSFLNPGGGRPDGAANRLFGLQRPKYPARDSQEAIHDLAEIQRRAASLSDFPILRLYRDDTDLDRFSVAMKLRKSCEL